MRLHIPTLATITVLVAAACEAPASPETTPPHPPLEAAVQQDLDDRSGEVFFNPCTGEYVGFDPGSARHTVESVKDDGAGGYHVRIHQNGRNYHGPGLEWDGTGFVPTGSYYHGNGVSNLSVNARPPFPWVGTFTNTVRVARTGGGPSMLFHETEHVTVTAGGEVSVDFLRGWFTCR